MDSLDNARALAAAGNNVHSCRSLRIEALEGVSRNPLGFSRPHVDGGSVAGGRIVGVKSRRRRKKKAEKEESDELVDIYDDLMTKVGVASRSEAHATGGLAS
jgi:hypothetical protein